jgi:protein-disulfide isomerase-like protein with CxxC motif
MARISVTHFGDPGCPWGYSANPALTALMWRYGDQLEWTHRMIGLTEHASQYEERGYTPQRMAGTGVAFRRFGMPFSPTVKDHVAGTSPACRAVVAVREQAPERELAAFRALQFLQFTTDGQLDVETDLERALSGIDGVDAAAAVGAIESESVRAAYEEDRAAARTAEGGAGHFQGKTANSDGKERFTAPSLIFSTEDGRSLEAAGFQSLPVYDVLIANLDPTLERRPAPEDVADLLAEFPYGLTTEEVAWVYAEGAAVETDRTATELKLLDAVAAGTVTRTPLGDDALWHRA